MKKSIAILFVVSSFTVFAQKSQKVFNLDTTKDTLYLNKTGVVNHYTNCRSENDDSTKYEDFKQSINSINRELASFIGQKKFDFRTNEDAVALMHKFYVNPKGEIEYCSFIARSVLSKKTTRNYAKLLEEFIEERKVNYESETPFFICGQITFRLKQM